MRHITWSESDTYPVALLIKQTAMNKQEIYGTYVDPLVNKGVALDEIVAISADYNDKGKAPVAFIKEYLEQLMPALASVACQYIYCADAAYFKVLTGSAKAEPHLGYILPCKIKDYEHMHVVLGVNHKSLIYNPANEPKLTLSLETLASATQGTYQALGADVIHTSSYPSTVESIRLELQELHQFAQLSCDIEAFSLDFEKAGIGTITFCWTQHDGMAFACDYEELEEPDPDNHQYGRQRVNEEVRALIKDFFETYEGMIVWHGSTYDLEVLIYELWMGNLQDVPGLLTGLEIMTECFHDTKTIAYLATNTTAGNSLGLKDLAHGFAGNWAKEDIKDIRRIPLPDLLQYNLIDGLSTNYVFDKFHPIMVEDQQEELYRELMRPSLKTIIQMEMTGMPLNPTRVQEVRAILEGIRDDYASVFTVQAPPVIHHLEKIIQRKAMDAANEKLKTKAHLPVVFEHIRFNPGSGDQVRILLYDLMGLPVIDRTDTKLAATGAKTLDKLIHHTDSPQYIEVLEALIGYSKAEKILNTFIVAFERAIDHGDDVMWMHGSFNLGGTKSGRLSSSRPNLQNIPSGSTYGKLVKSCFQAPEGHLFGGADYNSLEDYISALTTKDPNKLKVYLDGYDGHCLRAFSYFPERLPGIVETVDSINSIKKHFPEVRQESKAPTFALTYQGTWHTLVNNLGFDPTVAQEIEARYHDMYQVSDQWVQMKLDEASDTGYVTLAFGLRLRTPLLAQTMRNRRSTPYQAAAEGRTAGNALGQSYGLLTNRSMNAFMEKVWASPYRFDIRPVAMIHDANYFVFKDDIDVIVWANNNLIEEMQWQDLPEIQHPQVKLGASLDIFWPSWDKELTIPNNATEEEIRALCMDFQLDQKKEAA